MRCSREAVPSCCKRLAYDLRHVLREAAMVADALQRRLGMLLALRIEFAPAVERARHAGPNLGIQRVEPEDLVRQEFVAAAVGCMEAHVVRSEGADQRVHLVRHLDVERWMVEQLLYPGDGS